MAPTFAGRERQQFPLGPLPVGTDHIFIRMCAHDGRCANYEAGIESL